MKHRRWNLPYHELIGLRVTILFHSSPSLRGVAGTVHDETMNTLVIRADDGRLVRVPKSTGIFSFRLPDGSTAVIRGDRLLGRPCDRLRRFARLRGVRRARKG